VLLRWHLPPPTAPFALRRSSAARPTEQELSWYQVPQIKVSELTERQEFVRRGCSLRTVAAITCRVPNSSEETVPNSGSPALSMQTARHRSGTTENRLENEGRSAGRRPWSTESAGEPK